MSALLLIGVVRFFKEKLGLLAYLSAMAVLTSPTVVFTPTLTVARSLASPISPLYTVEDEAKEREEEIREV